jgi:hypothetical protein
MLSQLALHASEKTFTMKYDGLYYLDESQDPSIQLETEKLVARVIDNTRLETRKREE